MQTRRLDVAKVCLGHLKRAASARALRLAMQDDRLEEEAKVAVLAIELDMIEEAVGLYKSCGRFDLLNRLYQAAGKFDEVSNRGCSSSASLSFSYLSTLLFYFPPTSSHGQALAFKVQLSVWLLTEWNGEEFPLLIWTMNHFPFCFAFLAGH